MSFDPLVTLPAGYVTGQAIAFTTPNDHAVLVGAATPLPVAAVRGPTSAVPLAGTTVVSATLGAFTPELARPVWLTLSGSWTGAVQLLRSTDGGATKLPLTVLGQPVGSFTANANEAMVEESCAGATYYLQVTLSSGTLTYRVAQ